VESPLYEEELLPALRNHGYEGLYYARKASPLDAIQGPDEGVSLLYRTSRLTLIASQTVRWAATGPLATAPQSRPFSLT
jgi:hypothetical protein